MGLGVTRCWSCDTPFHPPKERIVEGIGLPFAKARIIIKQRSGKAKARECRSLARLEKYILEFGKLFFVLEAEARRIEDLAALSLSDSAAESSWKEWWYWKGEEEGVMDLRTHLQTVLPASAQNVSTITELTKQLRAEISRYRFPDCIQEERGKCILKRLIEIKKTLLDLLQKHNIRSLRKARPTEWF